MNRMPAAVELNVAEGLEVDFVMPGRGGRVSLVECKATRTVTPAMAVPMQRLAEALIMRSRAAPQEVDRKSLEERLSALFPAQDSGSEGQRRNDLTEMKY